MCFVMVLVNMWKFDNLAPRGLWHPPNVGADPRLGTTALNNHISLRFQLLTAKGPGHTKKGL